MQHHSCALQHWLGTCHQDSTVQGKGDVTGVLPDSCVDFRRVPTAGLLVALSASRRCVWRHAGLLVARSASRRCVWRHAGLLVARSASRRCVRRHAGIGINRFPIVARERSVDRPLGHRLPQGQRLPVVDTRARYRKGARGHAAGTNWVTSLVGRTELPEPSRRGCAPRHPTV